MKPKISVVIADDHALIRQMLGERLGRESDFAVAALCENAAQAAKEVARLKPDVAILDVDMPGMSCFDGARMIGAVSPGTRTIFLSAYFNDCYIEQALEVNAAGYVTKNNRSEAIVEAVRIAAAGGRYFAEEVESRLVVDRGGVHSGGGLKTRIGALTEREREVLRYVASGLSQNEIAAITHRSSKTIHTHCNNIMCKLDLHDRVALTRFAIREGLIQA